jgi:glycyl-tRNA synthetase beta chain
VMVMVEEEEIKRNRLALLSDITRLIHRFADFNQIVFA